MKTKVLISVLTILLVTEFSGCKKEKTNPGEVKQPDIAQNGVLIPTPAGLKNTNDPMARQVLNMFTSLNKAGTYIQLFTPPSGATPFDAEVSGAAAYTWTEGNTTYWLIYYETDSKYIWQLDADFGSGRDKYAYVEENKDEKSGTFDLYMPQQPVIHGEWGYDADGNFSIEITYQSTEGNIKISATENADGSGLLNYYLNGNVIISAQWNADGSGSYTIHTENGTFTGQWSSGK